MESISWDSANIAHIAAHGITPEGVEQALRNSPIGIAVYKRNGEERINQVGPTDEGRFLVVVTTMRDSRIRPVTAYPANRQLRQQYAAAREGEHDTGDGGSRLRD